MQVINQASILGKYSNIYVPINSNMLFIQKILGLTLTKTANKTVWFGGYLTYTITITNDEQSPYSNPIITDVLDPTKIVLVPSSVKLDGTPVMSNQYTYNATTGTLTVPTYTVSSGDTLVLTYDVLQK